MMILNQYFPIRINIHPVKFQFTQHSLHIQFRLVGSCGAVK